MRRTPMRRRGERGMTLVEVLVAFAILLVISLSILQLLSLALAVNMGSQARTELTYKAQQVAETIRYIYAFEQRDPTVFGTLSSQSGVDLTGQLNSTVTLPGSSSDGHFDFWGPAGFHVVDASTRYELRYHVAPGANGNRWVVTVVAEPREGGRKYLGAVSGAKAVRYVATIR